ncbi:MAG: multidrug efflux RND transporter permease subunit [Helicobacteraceae bacterium]|jgi:hydrophobe/amphiphile efflux-1 (HAE1) family protein|nr:multidrug efflux RND transporter permease subunit [Helicobacteraceae bacterium]
MFSKFFIERPIAATVMALIVILCGVISIRSLPLEEYPDVLPAEVMVRTSYPGASAETAAQTVATPLEQAINGVENMIYIASSSSASGEVGISVYFETGTDPAKAQIDVNNRVQSAIPRMPDEVQQQGVTVYARTSTILEIIAMRGDPARYDAVYVSNYASLNLVDEIKRIKGVGDAIVMGGKEYAMRIWLRPDRLAKLNLTPNDVIMAIREQNAQYAPGSIGQEPMGDKQTMFTYTIAAQGRLTDPEGFGNIIIRANPDGTFLRVKDVATVELGAQNYSFVAKQDKLPAAAMMVFLQTGANALEVADRVNAAMEEMSQRFPEGVTYEVTYDTTKFVRVSIQEVVKTFIEAIALVSLVIFFFLQNIRATIIPILAVPVSIIGAFAGLYLLGFSINLLTLFGLVLAIGVVVDDAIIVIENVERILREQPQLSVRQATILAMTQVTSPVIAIVLVLCAVFIPVMLMPGFTGEMYRQFAATLVISVILSGMVALTLTPALCGVFLRKHNPNPIAPLRFFNEWFMWTTENFAKGVRQTVRFGVLFVLVFIALMCVTYYLFKITPTTLVPNEDKGAVMFIAMLPPAASLNRTVAVTDWVADQLADNPAINHITALSGYDMMAGALKPSSAAGFIQLKDWSERTEAHLSSFAIAGQLMGKFMMNPDALIFAMSPPTIMGLSLGGGFDMHVQDRTGGSIADLAKNINALVQKANQHPKLTQVRATLNAETPQYHVVLDRDKAKLLGISMNDLFAAMQATFGSYYVNDFNMFSRAYRVMVQAHGDFRQTTENLDDIFVRTNKGEMVPLSAIVKLERAVGPDVVQRFNLFNSVNITGDPKPGISSGEAIKAIEEVAAEVLPQDYTLAWSGSSYQEKTMEGTGMTAFIFGVALVFLILAALYERWLMPLAVVAAVPFAVFGAITATHFRGLENELYFQIGLVVLIALAAKNAILIVEFAMLKHEGGLGKIESAIEAARMRFRPIIMTSLAFMLGVSPLAMSQGAGEAARHAIGTGVIGGMLAATFIAIFYIPLFYVHMATVGDFFAKLFGKGKNV